jgi:hypothetical protein
MVKPLLAMNFAASLLVICPEYVDDGEASVAVDVSDVVVGLVSCGWPSAAATRTEETLKSSDEDVQ